MDTWTLGTLRTPKNVLRKKYNPLFSEWTLGHWGHSGHSGHSKIFWEKNMTLYIENGHLDTQDTWDTQKFSVKKIWPSILRMDTWTLGTLRTLKIILWKKSDPLCWEWTLGHSGHSGHSKIFCEKNLTLYFENGHWDRTCYLFVWSTFCNNSFDTQCKNPSFHLFFAEVYDLHYMQFDFCDVIWISAGKVIAN